jgi:hypothetical protein
MQFLFSPDHYGINSKRIMIVMTRQPQMELD